MFFRLLDFLLWQLAGVAMAFLAGISFTLIVDPFLLVLSGAFLGSLSWALLNAIRAGRVLIWLRGAGDPRSTPSVGGIWAEVIQRTRRLLKQHLQNTQSSDQRLDDFLSAIQVSPNGVLLLDANGQIEWCNATAAEHFGLDAKADVSQHIGNLVRDPVFTAYLSEDDFTHDVKIAGKNNSHARPCRLAVQIHPYGLGRKLLLSNDITAVELSELMRRDFVANVSHEIRTPLTVLSGFVESLQTLPLNDFERDKYLGLMAQQANRMETLVNDLLILSRLEGSPSPLADTWLKVSALMTICEQEARSLSDVLSLSTSVLGVGQKKAQNFVFEISPTLEIAGVQTELLSAMSNLINNAVRYTPMGGQIRVVFQVTEQGKAIFSVSDTGSGIASEHLSRLTERFYRVDTSRSRESGGTGLGLAIVKHVVQRHGGELTIESTLGKGSTFSFTLPVHRVRVALKNQE
jgi:two-component system, OmpR family, phosphate regulon sensor histidine kinase PhoR